MITLPVDGISDITTYLGTFITDLWPVIALVVGVPFAFFVINKIISVFTRRAK